MKNTFQIVLVIATLVLFVIVFQLAWVVKEKEGEIGKLENDHIFKMETLAELSVTCKVLIFQQPGELYSAALSKLPNEGGCLVLSPRPQPVPSFFFDGKMKNTTTVFGEFVWGE